MRTATRTNTYRQDCEVCGATAATARLFSYQGGARCGTHLTGDDAEYQARVAQQLADARTNYTDDERETVAAYERVMYR